VFCLCYFYIIFCYVSPAWGLGERLKTHYGKESLLRQVKQDLGLDGSCEHGNESSRSIKGGGFLDWLSDY
jgi:hypothetical protein